jgi:hypothetical protein
VKIVADTLLLAVADFEDFAFELPAGGGVLQHGQPEALAAQDEGGDGGLDEQDAVALIRAAHREFTDQRGTGTRRDFVGGFGDASV